jgi:hypothetical protein
MSKQSSYQKLLERNKLLRAELELERLKFSNLSKVFDMGIEDMPTINSIIDTIRRAGYKKSIDQIVPMMESRENKNKKYLMGSIWDNPCVIRSTKISWFSKIINKLTKK